MRVRRIAKEIVAENPPVPLPILLVLVTRVLDLEPGSVRRLFQIEPHCGPQIAAVIEGQRVIRPLPPSKHKGVSPWPGGEAGGSRSVENGQAQETVG